MEVKPNPHAPHLFEPMTYMPEKCRVCSYGIYDSLHNDTEREVKVDKNTPHKFEPDDLLTNRCKHCGGWKEHSIHNEVMMSIGEFLDAGGNTPHDFVPGTVLHLRCKVCGATKGNKLHHMIKVVEPPPNKPLPEFTERDLIYLKALERLPL